jgi:hypothetical protein
VGSFVSLPTPVLNFQITAAEACGQVCSWWLPGIPFHGNSTSKPNGHLGPLIGERIRHKPRIEAGQAPVVCPRAIIVRGPHGGAWRRGTSS